MANKAKKSRKIRNAAQLKDEAERKTRASLVAAGLPEHRVAGAKVHEFREETFADLKSRQKVIRSLFSNTADRWFAEGGPGFDEPQKRALDHVRSLWACIGGSGRLVSNYTGVGGGTPGEGNEKEVFALSQLAEYKKEIAGIILVTALTMVWHNPSEGKSHKLVVPVIMAIFFGRKAYAFAKRAREST